MFNKIYYYQKERKCPLCHCEIRLGRCFTESCSICGFNYTLENDFERLDEKYKEMPLSNRVEYLKEKTMELDEDHTIREYQRLQNAIQSELLCDRWEFMGVMAVFMNRCMLLSSDEKYFLYWAEREALRNEDFAADVMELPDNERTRMLLIDKYRHSKNPKVLLSVARSAGFILSLEDIYEIYDRIWSLMDESLYPKFLTSYSEFLIFNQIREYDIKKMEELYSSMKKEDKYHYWCLAGMISLEFRMGKQAEALKYMEEFLSSCKEAESSLLLVKSYFAFKKDKCLARNLFMKSKTIKDRIYCRSQLRDILVYLEAEFRKEDDSDEEKI